MTRLTCWSALRTCPSPARNGNADGTTHRRQNNGHSFVSHVERDDANEIRSPHEQVEKYPVGDRVAGSLEAEHPLAWFPAESSPYPALVLVVVSGLSMVVLLGRDAEC